MEPDNLPDAEDLWWSWVVLAALHRAVGDETCWFEPDQVVLALDGADGSWLRMQRPHGRRTVLWGRSTLALESSADARSGAPDWALTEATEEPRPTFVAWHAHGEWDLSAPYDEGAVHLLRPLLTVDPRAVELVRSGAATPETLASYAHGEHLEEAAELVRQAHSDGPSSSRGLVGSRLRDQIHGQMRDGSENDRMLMRRPPKLVQWSRINGPGVPFEYAVMAVRDQMTPAATNTPMAAAAQHSLTNVLLNMHSEEASEQSGAWLFARVTSDGIVIRCDRAFDSWPPWYQVQHASQGPSLDDLTWEMRQREPQWRPAWASLLPTT